MSFLRFRTSSRLLPQQTGAGVSSSRGKRREDVRNLRKLIKHAKEMALRDVNGADNIALPAGWYEAFDSNSGRKYYKNDATQQSQWQKPTLSPANVIVGEIAPAHSGRATERPL